MYKCKYCGREFNNRFQLAGHVSINHTSIENKLKREAKRLQAVRKPKTEEHKRKISEANKGKHNYPAWNKGLTKETDPRVRKYAESLKGKPKSEETKRKISEARRKNPVRLFGDKNPARRPEVRKKISEAVRAKMKQLKKEGKRIGRPPGFKHSEEQKQLRRIKSLKYWRNPKWAIRMLKKLREASNVRPTKPEKILIEIIKEHNFPFKYVGDGKLWIGWPPMNPDFIEVNGRKLVIEVLGDYWHTPEEFDERKKRYAKYGFKCIGIWEKEIYNNRNQVINKLKRFLND